MAAISNLISYELNGVKESFANWISNISPTDTPFTSMTGKESIQNKYFQWQEDRLSAAGENAVAEGEDAIAPGASGGPAKLAPTKIQKNVTQILRKVVQVSDTADALSSYGRGSELAYQMEKAGAELKRDIEWALLNNGDAADLVAPGAASTASQVRKTAGFASLVTGDDITEAGAVAGDKVKITIAAPTTGAAGSVTDITEDDLFKLTANLYLAGSTANIIMFHPSKAKFFSGLMETNGNGHNRQRMFDGASDTQVNTYVSSIVDPLGQEFKLIPNRFMPINSIYVFDPSDWTQMVLRAPQRTKLAKNGNYEKWMIETEIGLRHRNGFASGVIIQTPKA